MTEEKLSKIERGLHDANEDLVRGRIVRKGYEKELSRLLLKELKEKASALFVAETPDLSDSDSFAILEHVRGLLPRGESGARFSKYFTELYEKKLGELNFSDVFVRDAEEDGTENEVSSAIAFVSGGNIDLSYRLFAEKLAFTEIPSPIHAQRLSAACDAVLENEAGYAVIPVRSSVDGRLRSFYRTIDAYDLKIVSVALIGNDDGEMSYALCSRQHRPFSEMPSRIEISLPSDAKEAVALVLAAQELGFEPEDISSSPSERDGEIYSFTFSSDKEVFPLILYLNVYHPKYTLIGLYDILSER